MFGGRQGGGGMSRNASSLSTKGSPRAVPFSRSVTAADTAFASTTVVFPRSSKPLGIQLTSGVAVAYQVQGMGAELFAGAIGANVPAYLDLSNYPEQTAITIQTEILAAGAVAGAVEYT